MKTKHKLLAVFIIASILSLSYAVFLMMKEIDRPKLPLLGQVPQFILTDSQGRPFHSARLEGKTWIANFFFTTCSGICPVLTKNMAALHRTFEAVKEVTLLSITVNPENDTPEVLAKYAEKFKANTNKWLFLTGKREDITQLIVKGFKLGSVDEPIFHSASLALVDRYGFIRGYYDGTDQEAVNKLFVDAAVLVKEKKL